MNGPAPPPVKKNRAGDLRSTSPKTFGLVDHTRLVCGAQTWCEHGNTRIEYLASGPHHAKEVCSDCGHLLRWIAKPANTERHQFNSYRIAKLAMTAGLNSWERCFVKSLSLQRRLSPKQQTKLDELCDKFKLKGRQ